MLFEYNINKLNDKLKAEMKTIQQQMVEANDNERASALKK